MRLTLETIARWCGASLRTSAPEGAHSSGTDFATGYSIDTRTLAPGDLFFAIQGEQFDAHAFVQTAFERGACGAVVARSKLSDLPTAVQERPLLLVDNPLLAMQCLATAVREHWGKRVIAVTGSAGKTTTKEAIAAVLSSRFHVLKSQGNLNNHFGLPLQLLKLQPEDELAVVEMGMSAAGEIALLCRIARPDWGVVTNVGSAHAENFADGVAGIARAKRELIEALPGSGIAFLNADDPRVALFGSAFPGRTIFFGTGAGVNVRAEEIVELGGEGMRFQVTTAGGESAFVGLALLGRHNVANALAAIAVGVAAGISLVECAEAISAIQPGDKRGEVIEVGGVKIINDCYNSNPEALQSMIHTLASVPARRRILVAGEMLELGPESERLHAESGEVAGRLGIDVVLGVRGQARALVAAAAARGGEALFVETPAEAGEWLRHHVHAGDAVLLKASRGVRLEAALDAFPVRTHGG